MSLHLRFSVALLAVASAVSFVWLAQAQDPRPKSQDKPFVEFLNRDAESDWPFSDAVRVGDWLILSGKIGTDGARKLVPGGIQAETKQTMENLRSVLEAYGSSFDDVVKCTVMLADMKEWPAMNEVYRTYFKKGRYPARSALGASGLALGARVEIECWAVVKHRTLAPGLPQSGNPSEAVKKDHAQFEGEWSMISAQRDGQSLPDDIVKGSKRVAKDAETTVTIDGTLFMKAKYTIDATKKPKTIDYTFTAGPNKGKKQLGIYELDGDRLKFCTTAPGMERPTDFTAEEGSGRTVSVWKRDKK